MSSFAIRLSPTVWGKRQLVVELYFVRFPIEFGNLIGVPLPADGNCGLRFVIWHNQWWQELNAAPPSPHPPTPPPNCRPSVQLNSRRLPGAIWVLWVLGLGRGEVGNKVTCLCFIRPSPTSTTDLHTSI